MPGKLSIEKAIAALLKHGSVRDSAKALRVSEATVYRVMSQSEFESKFQEARRNLVNAALGEIQKNTSKAVRILCEMMENSETPASVRATCARSIVDYSNKWLETIDLVRRIEELEARFK